MEVWFKNILSFFFNLVGGCVAIQARIYGCLIIQKHNFGFYRNSVFAIIGILIVHHLAQSHPLYIRASSRVSCSVLALGHRPANLATHGSLQTSWPSVRGGFSTHPMMSSPHQMACVMGKQTPKMRMITRH